MSKTIVILHGWGKSGKDYEAVQDILEKKGYTVFAPDMPGFGKEALKKTMVLDDYVDFVKEYLKKKKISKAIFIGHSFGGRVIAKLAGKNPQLVDKLFLTGAPLIKQPLSLKKQIISSLVKPAKVATLHLPLQLQHILRKSLYRYLGEWDYYKSGHLTETFKNIIQEDVKDILPKISVPTYLIWGDEDTFVPKYVGQEIAAMIDGAQFVSVEKASHKLPYEKPHIFAQYILRYLS